MKVRELLSDESKWTQGVSARDSKGESVGVFDLTATCWCLIGALAYCYSFDGELDILRVTYKELNGQSIGDWNDSHSFTDVKTLIEKLDI